ncbi:LysR substrate-binding domain-containing protein [Puniceibacterium sediminis]|uniref:LysR family transcriptional regulator, glycine cleavage system transcriptional activator n=1 Tax=Puniceibacterium sediminis TaxID=1608407 RepID=A0A238XFW1_9RHOB|nr:LysR substrate-binding domain-containing protein [Puniceibacterium sediminis]SNR56819.1 LysR family transcriptional regulator, glycine cleavage system transcriptional activator [Puniceibacterium sediminis]
MPTLPRHVPLNALQGFEAAARHLNMRRAGEELHITQSAISHQVRAIEAALGQPLFEANRRKLVLTAQGKRLHDTVRRALDDIAATTLQLGEDAFSASLSVAAPRAFAAQWLVPRLPRFLDLFPDLTLKLSSLPAEIATGLPRVDAAVVFNQVDFPGMQVETLVALEMFPVCAPSLTAGVDTMSPGHLRNVTLIHEDGGTIWARWFAAMGAEQVSARRHVYASNTQDALALARGGAGFAIDDGFLGGGSVATGALVRPFGASAFPFGQYALVTQPHDRLSPATLAFRDWLRREISGGGQV